MGKQLTQSSVQPEDRYLVCGLRSTLAMPLLARSQFHNFTAPAFLTGETPTYTRIDIHA